MDVDSPHVLYRFWREDELLYVGISINAYARAMQHKTVAEWWPEATHVTFETHPNRAQVLAAELAAIRSEAPAYNVSGVVTRAPSNEGRKPDGRRWRRNLIAVDGQRRVSLGPRSKRGQRFWVTSDAHKTVLTPTDDTEAKWTKTRVDDKGRVSIARGDSIVEPGDTFRVDQTDDGFELIRVSILDHTRMPNDLLDQVREYIL